MLRLRSRRDFEKAGEGITFAPAVLADGFVQRIRSLVARRGTGKATHRLRLRTEERRGSVRESKTARLTLHHTDTGVFLGIELIAEGNVTVAHTEDDVHDFLTILLILGNGFRSLVMHVLLLNIPQRIVIANGVLHDILLHQALRVVADIRHYTKGRAV